MAIAARAMKNVGARAGCNVKDGDEKRAVLDGVLAVPCNPQSAIAGLNSGSRPILVGLPLISGVEGRAPRKARL